MSGVLRFFVPAEMLRDGEVLTIDGEVLHHMQHVLRLREGDEVLLLDGVGGSCRVRLKAATRTRWEAAVLQRRDVAEQQLPVTLIQALPKGDKFDLILQKGTELGVSVFQPVVTSRTVSRPDEKRIAQRLLRWQRIVQEAARQSRRDCLPQIRPLCSLEDAVTADPEQLKLALWEDGAEPLGRILPAEPPAGVSLLVGPEGGLSAEEVSVAVAAGFRAVHLGPRILRTETAGLAVAPVLQYLYGDWRNSPSVD